ncbi:hypothetical protein CsSME_00012955 [Camellia sinensis var. sinensis]
MCFLDIRNRKLYISVMMENAFGATEQIVFLVGGCWNLKLVSVSFEASKSLGDPPIILWNIVSVLNVSCYCFWILEHMLLLSAVC